MQVLEKVGKSQDTVFSSDLWLRIEKEARKQRAQSDLARWAQQRRPLLEVEMASHGATGCNRAQLGLKAWYSVDGESWIHVVSTWCKICTGCRQVFWCIEETLTRPRWEIHLGEQGNGNNYKQTRSWHPASAKGILWFMGTNLFLWTRNSSSAVCKICT